MPLPLYVELTAACEHDLTVMRPVLGLLNGRVLMADRIYCGKPLNAHLQQTRNRRILTPVKPVRGQCQRLRGFDKAADDLFSTWVSRFRQPIESFSTGYREKPASGPPPRSDRRTVCRFMSLANWLLRWPL